MTGVQIKTPSDKTLAKYGMSAEDFAWLVETQGGFCYVCERAPSSGRLNIDHDHLPKYAKLPPEQRRAAVRGLLCYACNLYYTGRGITVRKAENVVRYLRAYAERGGGPFFNRGS